MCSPFVYCLVEAEHDEVEVLEDSSLFDLMPQQQAYRLKESIEHSVEHQLVLALGPDNIEGKVDRGLEEDEVGAVEENVRLVFVQRAPSIGTRLFPAKKKSKINR
jgi:hypothetical protein